MLEQSVSRFAELIAIEQHAGLQAPALSLTYAQLSASVLALAAHLRARGVKRGDRVGLHFGRSVEHVIALFALWALGAIAVSIEPEQPESRKESLLSRSAATHVLARSKLAWSSTATIEYRYSALDTPPQRLVTDDDAKVDSASEAYVLWTSGSTGRPKGVRVSHAGIEALVRAQVAAFLLTECDRVLWMTSVGFDAHLSDVLTTLASGATLVIDQRPASELATRWPQVLAQLNISVCDVAPAVLKRYRPSELAPSVKTLIVGGEPMSPTLLRAWGRTARVVAVYGPTEATVCTHLRVVDSQWSDACIGDAIEGVRERVEPSGELLVGGKAVALGYVDDPELTDQRFVTLDGVRWFATRDRVSMSERGLVFGGRLDRQLKIHGKLVCPEELEAAVARLGITADCAVLVERAAGADDVSLCLVLQAPVYATEAEVSVLLRRVLPAHLCPARICVVETLARGPSAKVDSEQLASTIGSAHVEGQNAASAWVVGGDDFTSALPALTAQILAVLRQELRADSLDAKSDLFHWGGDSLAVLSIAAKLRSLHIAVTPAQLYDHPDAQSLAAALLTRHQSPAQTGMTAGHLERLARRYARCVSGASFATPTHSVPQKAPRPEARAVVLTSATGQVGGATLARLLAAGVCTAVLVRAHDDGHAMARVMKSLRGWAVPTPVDPHLLQCWAIDPSKPRWGWTAASYAERAAMTRVVVNTAGRVHLIADLHALVDDNVFATLDACEFAASSPARAMIHVSTLSTAVASSSMHRRCDDGWELCAHDELFGGYAQSKLLAERAVLAVADNVLAQRVIVRLGLVVGDRMHGTTSGRDQLGACLRTVARVGGYPETLELSATCDATPVDIVAEVLSRIATSVGKYTGVINLAARESVSWGQWLRALARARVKCEPMGVSEFLKKLDALQDQGGEIRADTLVTRASFARAWPLCVLPAPTELFAATGWQLMSTKASEMLYPTKSQAADETVEDPLLCTEARQDILVRGALFACTELNDGAVK
jgi:amino acid adenylation domain-containing protein